MSTHPPLIVTFPPKPEKQCPEQHGEDDCRTVTGPTTLEQLLAAGNPYIMLDDSRFSSLHHRRPRKSDLISPIDSDSEHSSPEALFSPHPKHDQLPITHVTFDLRTLNMHLTLRVQEILACAEEMWGFVVDYQSRYFYAKNGLALVGPDWRRGPPPFHLELAGLDRREFDHMLMRFRM